MDREVRNKVLNFHKVSGRHVLVLEADMKHEDKCLIFSHSEKIRLIANELKAIIKKRLDQLMRTKKYRKLRKLYHKAVVAGDKVAVQSLSKQLEQMREEYGIDFEFLRAVSLKLKHKYNLHSHIVRSAFDDVWKGVDAFLFSEGRKLNFIKKGYFPPLCGCMHNTGIRICREADDLVFWYGRNIKFGYVHKNDRFMQEEISRIIYYLADPDGFDTSAAMLYQTKKLVVDTFRPCYLSLVPKIIRGKMRVFIHITLEGHPLVKTNRRGEKRHNFGTGIIGMDIGTQTVAFSCADKVGLVNLGQRGKDINTIEKTIRRLSREMDKSRRVTNPQNFNEDGTSKRGKCKWKYSVRYLKLRRKLRETYRKAAINRKLAINELVNDLREYGSGVVTEPMNTMKLMKRSKKTEISQKTGKIKRKKRFGKSIINRCPGYFQLKVKQVFTRTGGSYMEVANNYRASQYDVTADEYIRKSLSYRYYHLKDGTKVQRDMYSAYVLSCSKAGGKEVDKEMCKKGFEDYLKNQNDCISDIVQRGIHIVNSGIEIA